MSDTTHPLVYIILVVLFCVAIIATAFAQDHGHPQRDLEIHQKFYQTWMMPDNRAISCCHDEDCAPAESKFEDGRWLARKSGDDGDFTPVPPQKIEQDRDSPDGRSHICGRRYGFANNEFTVFCFKLGNGS